MAPTRFRLDLLPAAAGFAAALVAGVAIGLAPAAWLERIVESAALPALVDAARPPLGATARLLFAGAAASFAGATAWAALYLLFGPGGPLARVGGEDGMPLVRSADLHPDAPPRRPLAANEELGAPPPPATPPPVTPPAVCDLPRDLDQPLAAYDPAAIRPVPMEPARPVTPLASRAEPLAPGERFASVELPARLGVDAPSIESLLARLELGTMRYQERVAQAG